MVRNYNLSENRLVKMDSLADMRCSVLQYGEYEV